MTPAQFDVIAELLRSRGLARAAARLVLIDKAAQSATAAHLGMSQSDVSNAIKRYKAAHEKVIEAYQKR